MSESSFHILIVKLSAIGDVMHGLPVLTALRRHYPQAHLTWVVEGRAGELLAGHAALDRLLVLPRAWLKSPARVWQLRRQLRANRPKVVIDLQCLARSALLAWLAGAKVRIGFDGPDGREMSRWLHNRLVLPTATHVIDRNLELLRPLGIYRPGVRFDLPEYAVETQQIRHFVEGHHLDAGFAVLNPGAGWPSKRWEIVRFARVACHLGQHHSLPTVVTWAGAEERAWAEQIVAHSRGDALLAPPTSLRALASLVRLARVFVSSDTGPLHIAAAAGTPCVGLFGPVPAARNGPYGPNHISLQKITPPGPGRQRRQRHQAGNDAMRAITAEDVIEACDRILKRTAGHRECA